MVIDIHAHANYYGLTCEKLIENMDQYGIDKAWLLTLETPDPEYAYSYHKCTFVTKDGPIPFSTSIGFQDPDHRFILGYGPDPRKPDSIYRMEAAIDLYNVKVYGEIMLRMMYDNWDAIRMFRFCGKRKIPVIVELKYGIEGESQTPFTDFWYGGGIEVFERALRQCPDTIFFGHGAGFWAHISGDDRYNKENYPTGPIVPGGKLIDLMRRYDNLYLDLSAGSGLNAMKRDLSFTKEFLDEFQDRACYGRDFIDNAHQEFLNSLGLKQEIMDKIYYQNAIKLVPLD